MNSIKSEFLEYVYSNGILELPYATMREKVAYREYLERDIKKLTNSEIKFKRQYPDFISQRRKTILKKLKDGKVRK